MKVVGRDIGAALDRLYTDIERRLSVESERALQVVSFDGGGISNVEWREGEVVISVHSGVPTHALPHVLGVALQRVRQRLDLYPDVARPAGEQPEGADMVRQALRELVLSPEADMQLASLQLDTRWEAEQRHQGLKELLREPPDDWNEAGSLGNDFMALQYARFTVQHPKDMWEGLRKQMQQQLPLACERGAQAVAIVRSFGWGGPGACLESLVGVRNELELQDLARIEDRRSGEAL